MRSVDKNCLNRFLLRKMGERKVSNDGGKEVDTEEENITLEQCCSIVITNEGVTWTAFLRHYIRIFGVVNYNKLESFVHSNCPEHFVHDRGQVRE